MGRAEDFKDNGWLTHMPTLTGNLDTTGYVWIAEWI